MGQTISKCSYIIWWLVKCSLVFRPASCNHRSWRRVSGTRGLQGDVLSILADPKDHRGSMICVVLRCDGERRWQPHFICQVACVYFCAFRRPACSRCPTARAWTTLLPLTVLTLRQLHPRRRQRPRRVFVSHCAGDG